LLTQPLSSSIDTVKQQVYDSITGLYSNDCSNFFIVFSTEPDHMFQQGQVSNSPITYTFMAKLNEPTTNVYLKDCRNTPPIIVFLLDISIGVKLRLDGGPPIVEFSNADISSPL